MRTCLGSIIFLLGFSLTNYLQSQPQPDAGILATPKPPPPDYRFETFNSTDGLAGNAVSAVIQDHDGFMWFGSGSGLTRYNGYEAEVFFSNPDSTSLAHDWVEALAVDSSGTLWVGTFGGGLNRYDPGTNRFAHFRHDPNDDRSLSHDTVFVMLTDHLGTLWVGTQEGLNVMDPDPESSSGSGQGFTRYLHDPDDPNSLSNNQIRVLYEDQSGTIWVGTGSPTITETAQGEGGLNRFNRETGTFTRYMHDPQDPNTLSDNKVTTILEDSQGRFWVGTVGDGLHEMDRSTGTFVRHSVAQLISSPCLNTFYCGISFVHEDPTGRLWVGAHEGGLGYYDPDTGSLTSYITEMTRNSWKVFASSDGILWVGTLGFALGAYKVIPSRQSFVQFRHDPTDPNTPGHEQLSTVYEDRTGILWIGTRGGGLNRFDPESQQFSPIRHDPPNPNSLSSDIIHAIFEDQVGRLWIGTQEGLDLLDRNTRRVVRLRDHPDAPSLFSSPIHTIQTDHQQRIWVGTMEEGIGHYDPLSDTFNAYTYFTQVNSIRLGQDSTLWVMSNGLAHYDAEQDRFVRHPIDFSVNDLYEDDAGILWLGSWSGLIRYNPATGAQSRYSVSHGLPNAMVGQVIEDDDGFLWMPTPNDIVRFDPRTEVFQSVSRNLGLTGLSFLPSENHYRGAVKSKTGVLYFVSNDGLLAIDPYQSDEREPPNVVLTGLRVFNDAVIPGPNAPLQAPINRAAAIELDHQQHDFTIDYVGLDYQSTEPIRYAYFLENHDVDWVDARRQRSARYSGLDPGNYTFRVRAALGDDDWPETSRSIQITIQPPWWRTIWAYMLYGLLFIGAVFMVDRIQRRRLLARERERVREREREQARKLAVAHAELQQTHEHLKQTQQQLVQQEKLASLGELTAGIAHEIKNPLNFINNFAEMMGEFADELDEEIGLTQDISGNENTHHFKEILADLKLNAEQIAKHGRRADGIISAMMQHASGGTGQREPTDVNALVEEYVNLAYHGKRAQIEGFTCVIDGDYGKDVGSVEMVPQEIGRVLLNLLSNAFDAVSLQKSEREGFDARVSVSTLRLGDRVEIRITDNGPGIPTDFRQKIFEPFYTTKPTGSGTGLGLSMSHDIIVQGHGGTLTVESEEGAGAKFIVTLPI